MAVPGTQLGAQVAALHLVIKGMVGEGLYQGLARVALDIQSEAQKGAPIDTGNLRGSAFTVGAKRPGMTRVLRTPRPKRPAPEPAAIDRAVQETLAYVNSVRGPIVVTGFGASYGEIVHEGDPNKNWHKGAPQFVTRAIQGQIPRARKVIEMEMVKRLPR